MEIRELTQESKDRLFINILRGVAVFLMIWGHCVQYCIPVGIDFFENFIFKFIYSFHMPLFMLISGYLFNSSLNKRSLNEIITHRVSSLLYITIAGGIFIWILTSMIHNLMLRNVSILIDGKWLSSVTELWFIWSVLASTLIVSFAYKKINNVYLRILVLILGAGFTLVFPNGELNLYMYPYFLLGFLYSKYKEKFKSKIISVLKHLTIPVYIVLFMFFKKKYYIYLSGIFCNGYGGILNTIEINTFRWLIGLIGSIAIIDICKLIFDLFMKNKTTIPNNNPLEKLGEKSLQMYVLQTIFVSFWLSLLYDKVVSLLPAISEFFAQNIVIFNLLFSLGLAVICSFVIYKVNKLLEYTKISKLIFKR